MQLSRISEFKTEILGDELPLAPVEPTFDLNHDTTHFILEEVDELRKAQAEGDIVEIADALGDIIYFAAGQALKYGLPIDEIIEEIHRSNMTKTRGVKESRQNIKGSDAIKTASYSAPELTAVLWPAEETRTKKGA